ncbi:MAG: hypothetical protein EZS28_027237 [Streblomastix strix]|uniref:Uncharacterized protein n=1 Tax=Streblomastix strix TaxID=222440 RepID=A0A5J4V556_9EUKA|nr:MAG: hypothetical protein EZS28_027237 [Streblomastix strix]
MKININKELNFRTMEILNIKRQDHFAQSTPIKNQEIQIFYNPKTSHLQLPHLQNLAKLKGLLQNKNKGYSQPPTMIPEAKQDCQSLYPKSFFGHQKLEPKSTLLTISHPGKSGEKRQMQPFLLKSCIQNVQKATRSEQGPRKNEQGSNSENQIEIMSDSQTDQQEQQD